MATHLLKYTNFNEIPAQMFSTSMLVKIFKTVVGLGQF